MTLIEAVQSAIRRLHSSPRTEEAHLHWIRAFIRFHGSRHPRDMGAPEMTAFLNHLAVQRRVSASTQNQALCALVFLYRRVLGLEMPGLEGLERARRPEHLRAVLSPSNRSADRRRAAQPSTLQQGSVSTLPPGVRPHHRQHGSDGPWMVVKSPSRRSPRDRRRPLPEASPPERG